MPDVRDLIDSGEIARHACRWIGMRLGRARQYRMQYLHNGGEMNGRKTVLERHSARGRSLSGYRASCRGCECFAACLEVSA